MKIFFLVFYIFVNSIFAFDLDDFINNKNCDQVIDKYIEYSGEKEGFSICYDYKMKGAKLVGYYLKKDLVNKGNIKKRFRFYSEKNIKSQYRTKYKDYTVSRKRERWLKEHGLPVVRWDRGHLASDASFDWDEKMLRKTYSMANIIPMAPKVNRKTWVKAERYERFIATKLGSVFVLNGVVYSKHPHRLGKSRLAIPDGFWKMLYNKKCNFQKCFYFQNKQNIDVKSDRLKQHEVDCNSLLKNYL